MRPVMLIALASTMAAALAGCSNVPNHQDAWLSYKYNSTCGGYPGTSCGLDDTDAATRYYQALGIADPSSYTFGNWLSDTAFPATADAHAIYANLADLQLGRDMYCAQAGQKTACYVTNYGPAPYSGGKTNELWPSIGQALDDASQGNNPIATVAMIYDPSKTGANQVSFFTFDSGGSLLLDVALDGEGPKSVPRMCMACHGGSYDTGGDTASGSSFLPFDVFAFRYTRPGTTYTFDAQQEQLRKLNAFVAATKPAQPILDLINGLYPGGVTTAGTTAVDGYVPPGWSDNPKLYTGVVRPYCRTCHLAQDLSFASSSDFEGAPAFINTLVCTSHDMPHAQVPFGIRHPDVAPLAIDSGDTTIGFWNDPVATRDFGNFFKSQNVSSCLPTD